MPRDLYRAGERRVAAERGDQMRYYAPVHDVIRGDGPNPVLGIEALAVIDAATRSAASGRRETLDLTEVKRLAYQAARRQAFSAVSR